MILLKRIQMFALLVMILLVQQAAGFTFNVPQKGLSTDGLIYDIEWLVPQGSSNITLTLRQNLTLGAPVADGADLKTLFDQYIPVRWFSLALSSSPSSGKPFMKNADYWFIWPVKSQNSSVAFDCYVSDRWSNINGEPALDSTFGGRDNDLYLLDKQLTANGSVLSASCSVTRPLDTGDVYDVVIPPAGFISFGLAHGDFDSATGRPLKHRGTVSIYKADLVGGKILDPSSAPSSPGSNAGARLSDLYFWHGILMITAFWLLMVPATLLARFYKSMVPRWYFIHWKMQASAVGLVLVAVLLAAIELDWHIPEQDTHVTVGLTLTALLFVQIGLGYVSNALWFEGKQPQMWPDKLHWWLGRLIVVGGGFVNTWLGLQSLRDKDTELKGIGWQWPEYIYISYTALMAVILVLLEWKVGQLREHELVVDDKNSEEFEEDEELMADEQQQPPLQDYDTISNADIPRRRSSKWDAGKLKTFTGYAGALVVVVVGTFMITLLFA